MKPEKNKDHNNYKSDIAIIGGGAAGLSAAAAAAESGAKSVIVVEARRNTGGNGVFPLGIFAAGSRIQKDMAIDARVEDIFKTAMRYSHWKTDARVMHTLLEKSGDTIHWLENKGVKFDRVIHHFPNQVPEVFHIVRQPARTGREVMKALSKCCKNSSVRMLTQTRAKRLLLDQKGNVSGLSAETKDNECIINSKSIVIATGGFAGNAGLLKKHFPSYNENEVMHLLGIHYNGDGLAMAAEIGADTDDEIVLEMGAPKYSGPPSIAPLISKPVTIWINKTGERFADEGIVFVFSESANAVFRQPGKVCYVLLDENLKNHIISEGLDPLEKITITKSWPERLNEEIQQQTGKSLMTANSLEGIAKWIGIAPAVLKNTIDEYNSFCTSGHDHAFFKDRQYLLPLNTPPYYAIRCGVDLLTTHGGIAVDHHMQILNKEKKFIPGLYAAGVDIGGSEAGSYNLNLSGHAFGFSINSGRIAGENAAIYAMDK